MFPCLKSSWQFLFFYWGFCAILPAGASDKNRNVFTLKLVRRDQVTEYISRFQQWVAWGLCMPVFMITTNVFSQPGRPKTNCSSYFQVLEERATAKKACARAHFVLLHQAGQILRSHLCTRTDHGHPIGIVFPYAYRSFSILLSWLPSLKANISQRNRTRKCE